MTRPLVRAQRVVESRLLRLGQKLNDELGFRDQRLRFTRRQMRAGPTTWVLRNEQVEATGTVLPQGVVAELAPAANDESILYFGYNEEWQAGRGRDQKEFVSSNLRFVIAGIEEMPDLRFRLEWAGATTEDGGGVAYPGSGAAHPHWQFDVDAGWIDPPFSPLTETEVRRSRSTLSQQSRKSTWAATMGKSLLLYVPLAVSAPRSPVSITSTCPPAPCGMSSYA